MAAKPPFLYVLAAFGLMLGGFGTMYSVSSAVPLMSSRDQYVAANIEQAEAQLPLADALKPERDKAIEKQADALYARRGVTLPLAGMNLILSFLLFAGCVRALRNQQWGHSAWSLAALVSIPYTLLDCGFEVVQHHDLAAALRSISGPMAAFTDVGLSWRHFFTMLKGSLEVAYFVTCVLYLKRAPVRALYDGSATAAK